ncbi:MAG: glutamine-hydrolyzing carbamoyl-phosphate synthase small subunit [Planctomycetota bacterium]|nr:glutamine-hydrolyzing carbamoyl-phosphate synthase small subunit [Planctomycetota bacterium]
MRQGNEARLVLADGTVFRGRAFGAAGESGGEVVFNTCLSGYQEVITDPSYSGQIVAMTNPLIGNYGTNLDDEERSVPFLAGFVVRELSRIASNFRSTSDLDTYLAKHGVLAMEGVDTRALTRRLRKQGAMKGLISTETLDRDELLARLERVPELEGRDLVKEVTRGRRIDWEQGYAERFMPDMGVNSGPAPHCVVLDFGAKRNIFRSLVSAGFRVTVLPATVGAKEVLAEAPDGVMLSNGPGDPRVLTYAIDTTRDLLGKVPLFGICLGHQILCAAVGAQIYKLKFGHHGGNQPVKDLKTGEVEITSQNHGFAVDAESITKVGGEVTHLHLNDNTVSGFELSDKMAMSVQYHPEACPGPHDSIHLFQRFRELVTSRMETA